MATTNLPIVFSRICEFVGFVLCGLKVSIFEGLLEENKSMIIELGSSFKEFGSYDFFTLVVVGLLLSFFEENISIIIGLLYCDSVRVEGVL